MMIPTDMSAWTRVAFLSGITSWTESDGHHNMTKVNENQFTYSLDLSSYTTDLNFTFFVSDNHGRIGPNNGDGTEATLDTEVWGGQGNSGSFLLKHSTSEYSTYKIILTWKNQGNDGKHYWTVKVAGETKKPIQVWLGNNLNGDEGSGWTRTDDNLFTTVEPDSEWIYTLTNPNKDFKFKIMWSYGSGTSTVNYYAPTNTYQIGDVETISSTGSDVAVGNESKYKNYTFKVTKNQDTWKLRLTVECNHGTGYTYTAYYINSTEWPEVFGYAFKDNKPVTISFPGEQCTKTTETIDGNDVWKWEIELGSADGVPDGIIFSNGYDGDVVYDDKSHNQTGNQYFINEGIYAYYAYNGDTYSTSIYKAAIPDGTTADGNKFEINHDVTAQTVELKREDFIADKWATVCLPFNITASDLSNYGDFYKIKSYANNKVTFEGPLTTDITAYTPYLFKPKNSGKLFTNLTDVIRAGSLFARMLWPCASRENRNYANDQQRIPFKNYVGTES